MPDLSDPIQQRLGQEFFVAPTEEALRATDEVDDSAPPRSLWQDAWHSLRRNPMFLVSAVLIVLIIAVAAFPSLFTSQDPGYCELGRGGDGPSSGHWFGFDRQGCDVYARVIFGARASVLTGVSTTIGVVLIGGVIGAIAGFYGGWVDAVLSRIVDIFFAVPLVLAAIVVLQLFRGTTTIWHVVAVLAVFGWTSIARITRGAVLSVKNSEFVTAATALGASRWTILTRHVVPNAIAPVIVTATVSLGTFIVAEATLSFLGLGLPSSIVSWGGDISTAQVLLRTNPSVLFYPAAALAVTVLSFILLGDAVREALDPKARKR